MNDLIYGLDEILSEIFEILPSSPFVAYISASNDSDIQNVLAWLNYFVDVPLMIVITEAWTLSIAGWFVVSAIMRWVKAVQ